MKYIFVEEPADWRQMLWEDMTVANQEEATEAWRKAEIRPVSDSPEFQDEAAVVEEEENNKIQEAIGAFIRKDLKWTHRELHDALLVAGVAVPSVPPIRNYVSAHPCAIRERRCRLSAAVVQKPYERQAAAHFAHIGSHGLETRW